MNTEAFCPEEKRPGIEAEHSTPSGDDVTVEWSYTSIPLPTFMTSTASASLFKRVLYVEKSDFSLRRFCLFVCLSLRTEQLDSR
jgi:hypothetical protein